MIGKKSVKLSVERNRLKRQIRESFRLNQDNLVGWDIVVVARKGLGDLQNAPSWLNSSANCGNAWRAANPPNRPMPRPG